MSKQQLKKKYQKETAKLVKILKQYQPEKIILFGSVAQDTMRPDSDVDLCLIKKFKGAAVDQKRLVSRLLWDNDYQYEVEPEFHVYKSADFNRELKHGHPFIEKIFHTGRILYEKSR